ncbi:MAG TPA: hypothetical protein VJB05_01030 [archaeon]|nr:hypothetical protein [archaeon]
MTGKIVTLTGPSGIGKGYLKPRIATHLNAEDIPVYTTRSPRNEHKEPSRIFVADYEFDRMNMEGHLKMVHELFGHRYGFGVQDLERAKFSNGYFITEVHVSNVPKFRDIFPDANMIALVAGSFQMLEDRMEKRGETHESLKTRLEVARVENVEIYRLKGMFDFFHEIHPEFESTTADIVIRYLEGYYALSDRDGRTDMLR